MTALDIVVFAYLGALLCVFVMEVYPRGRWAHVAALSSIFMVVAGGATWAYVAYFDPHEWPHFEIAQQAMREAKPKQSHGVVKFGKDRKSVV